MIPQAALPPIAATANVLTTIVSMAALGLGVDVRSVAGAGRVTLAVVASLIALTAVSLCLIQLLASPDRASSE